VSPMAAGLLLALGLFAGMLALLEIGWRLRRRQRALHGAEQGKGTGPVEASLLGLLGLLLAFTFSGAASRFDARREMIVHEANAIGTVWARLDLADSASRATMQGLVREYVDQRLAIYDAPAGSPLSAELLARTAALQTRIWTAAVAAVKAA